MVNPFTRKRKHFQTGDRLFYLLNSIILVVLFFVVLYPIVYIVSSSFSSGKAIVEGRVILWPIDPTLDGYKEVLTYSKIATGYINTLLYTATGTILGITITFLCAFPLSRTKLFGRKLWTFLFVFTMYFNGGLIPTFLLVNKIGLYNTRAAVVVLMMFSVFNVLVARTYFASTIPEELYESAQIDGCNDFRFFIYIVLPLSTTITAVMALFYAIRYWNDFFVAFIYLSSKRLVTLQIVMREVLFMAQSLSEMIDAAGETSTEETIRLANMYELIRYCVIVVASLPIISIYPFMQRYFVKGTMIGSLKG